MRPDQLLSAFEMKECMLIFDKSPSAMKIWLAELAKEHWFLGIHLLSWAMLCCYYIFFYNPPHSESGWCGAYHLPPVFLALFPAFLVVLVFLAGNLLDDYTLPLQATAAIYPLFFILAFECGVIFFTFNYASISQDWHKLTGLIVLSAFFVLGLIIVNSLLSTWRHLSKKPKEVSIRSDVDLVEIKRQEKEQMRKNMEYHKKVAERKAARAKKGNVTENSSTLKAQDSVYTDWKPELQSFYKSYIEPYAKGMKNIGVFGAVVKIIKILDLYGNQPSISNDKEAKGYKNDPKGQAKLEVFKKVTLLEHSINTVEAMIEDRKKNEPGYKNRMEVFLFCGLGHDLGKIGKLKAEHANFKEADHWVVSKQIMEEIIPDNYNPKKDVLRAVGNHHNFVDRDQKMDCILKDADQTARAREMKKYAPLTKTINDPSDGEEPIANDKSQTEAQSVKIPKYRKLNLDWLDKEQMFSIIGEKINVFQGYHHDAFFYKGIVYVQPSFICNTIGALAGPHDMKIATNCNEQQMSRDIAWSFRQDIKEFILDKIGDNYIGQRYRIVLNNGKKMKALCYIPIKIDAFSDEIEMATKKRRKDNRVADMIVDVEVAAKAKSTTR